MRLLYVGYNFSPELTGIGKYSGEMMYWLAKRGHSCKVITAYPYYPQWKVQPPYRKNRFWFKKEKHKFESGGQLTIIRCPMYVPSNPSGLKRICTDFSFLFTSSLLVIGLLFYKKYDWAITVAPSFQIGLLGVLYKKLKRSKHWYHIQDLQIEAAQDLGMIKSNRVLKFLFALESSIIDNSNKVSSISTGMMNRIAKKTDKPITFFPNWSDIETFQPIEDKTELKKQFGLDKNDWVVLYSGAIGEKQGLESILDAASTLREHSKLKFIICGTGPYKEKLGDLAKQMELSNVHFFSLQPMEVFNAFLNMADLHLVIQKEKASDLVMPSKLTTILAVGGIALVTANKESSLHQVISEHDMGILVQAENTSALTKAIELAFLEKNHDRISKKARLYAEKYLDKNQIMERFLEGLNQ